MTYEDIRGIPYRGWKQAFLRHLVWSQACGMRSGSPNWDDNGLNVIGIRNNPLTSFYVKDRDDWNDYLILVFCGTHILRCTTDPAVVNVNPEGIAHLNEGCWDSYVRGYHRGNTRRALVQSKRSVVVTRTDANGRVLTEQRGFFGINIHNAAGFTRPSAGCTVIMPKKKLGILHDENYHRFREILDMVPSRDSRTYCLMNMDQLTTYLEAI